MTSVRVTVLQRRRHSVTGHRGDARRHKAVSLSKHAENGHDLRRALSTVVLYCRTGRNHRWTCPAESPSPVSIAI